MTFYSFLGYIAFVSFLPQQAFNATAVVRHMRRLQLGTSHEGPSPTLPGPCRSHLLMPEEDAGTVICLPHTHTVFETVNAALNKMSALEMLSFLV